MIINENNKNVVLKGMVKRGFNQDPGELKARLSQNLGKANFQTNNPKPVKQPDKPLTNNGNLRETFNELRRLK